MSDTSCLTPKYEHRDVRITIAGHMPNEGPPRRSTHALDTRPVATETNLSPHGPRECPGSPDSSLKDKESVPAGNPADPATIFLALPVLLEPAPVIAVNSQVDAQKAGDRRTVIL